MCSSDLGSWRKRARVLQSVLRELEDVTEQKALEARKTIEALESEIRPNQFLDPGEGRGRFPFYFNSPFLDRKSVV